MYFTNSSKNNLIYEQKNYGGAIPQVVPYKFEYTYDTAGYPTEVYTSYKRDTSQQHLYRIKKNTKTNIPMMITIYKPCTCRVCCLKPVKII